MNKALNCLLAFGLIAALLLAAGCRKSKPKAAPATGIKLGFIIKQPEEPWFQLEWKFADQAARELGFELVKIGAADGEKALAAIDSLAASGAKGFVICTPDPKLGPAIAARAAAQNLKVIAVDDRFVGADGKPMENIPYLGISAYKIGWTVGKELFTEMAIRGWQEKDTGLCVVSFDELETARQRTTGATEALLDLTKFPAAQIFRAPQKASDLTSAIDATGILLTQHPEIKHWLICGMNDSAVLGAVRATESRGITADNVIGIGIDGTDCIHEFEKARPTGFFASVLLSARQHGHDTAASLFDWVKNDKAPEPETLTTGRIIRRDDFRAILKEEGIRN